MTTKKIINEFVRRRMRELRQNRKLKIREIAKIADMPYSSYASLERGFYNISLDNLFRILSALEADISDVWPVETAFSHVSKDQLYLQKIEQFRLGELITLSGAQGAGLFSLEAGECQILLQHGFDDSLLKHLVLCLEKGLSYDHGLWFRKGTNPKTFHFFLKIETCPTFLEKLIRKYMDLWSELYQ